MSYQLTQNPMVVVNLDGGILDPETGITKYIKVNCIGDSWDRQQYYAWLKAGGVSTAAEPPSRASRQAEIDRIHETSQTVGVDVGGKLWGNTLTDRVNMLTVLMAIQNGVALPANFGWRTVTDEFVTLTQAQFIAMSKNVLLDSVRKYLKAGTDRDNAT